MPSNAQTSSSALSVPVAAGRISRSAGLGAPVGKLKYVTGSRAEAMSKLGLATVRDLLLHTPRRYLDFTEIKPIATTVVGEPATVVGRIDRINHKRPRPRLSLSEVDVVDDTGVLRAVFFNQRKKGQFAVGDVIALSGDVKFAYGFREMNSPYVEVISKADGSGSQETSRRCPVLPVHGLSEGISAAWMRRIMSEAVEKASDVVDPVPSRYVRELALMGEGRAYRLVHFPQSVDEAEQARRRLAYDELLLLQLALLGRQRIDLSGVRGVQHVTDGPHVAALRAALPFALTDEQEQAVAEILHDMARERPMRRLLLGDVGTGKTAVASVALAACADSATQAAMMAPTSVLAGQYAAKVGPLLESAGVSWALLTGAVTGSERERIEARVAAGEITVVFGTTALLSEGVDFQRLSLVVVDEQHRFGVDQRAALRRKGAGADLLTMSATPIPRTLALSIYGDVACSRIAHRPRAGSGITTKAITLENLDVAFGAIREAVEAGQQAYVVCPLVDDNDADEEMTSGFNEVPNAVRSGAENLHSAVSTLEHLKDGALRGMNLALLTGRMSPTEKDEVMGSFRDGKIDVLVSTTVIEVGVDVPNATVMLVYDADRFGLATLHQLRGRVGRGDIAGQVFLETSARKGSPARERLAALEATDDGFELATLDLKLRREGEILGYKQSGGLTLKLVDLDSDADLVAAAHAHARTLEEADPALELPEHRLLAQEVWARYHDFLQGVD